MEADDILTRASLINRHLYRQKIADAAEALFRQQQPTAYIGFDAGQGLAKLEDASGNISYGSAETNGAVRLGDNIRLRRGGVIPGYDSMPRHQKPTPVKKTEQVEEYLGIGNFRQIPGSQTVSSLSLLKKTSNIYTKFSGTPLTDILFYGIGNRLSLGIGGENYSQIASLISYNSIVGASSDIFYYFYGVGTDINFNFHKLFNTHFTRFKISLNSRKIKETVIFNLQTTSLVGANIAEFGTTVFTANTIRDTVQDGASCVVKYLDSSNILRLVCVSFSVRGIYGAIAIWDIGTPENIETPSNPACYFGRNYLLGGSVSIYAGNGVNGGANLKNLYASRGGIVIVLQNQGQPNTDLRIFVPESNLRGTLGKKASNLIVGSEVSDLPFINSQQSATESDISLDDTPIIGDIPPPLDTRSITLDKKPFYYDIPSIGISKNFIYYVSVKDFGKAYFT
ncbi:MAG: hypothetical protein V7L02_23265 [Nostoc sp.]|uniref:hypothetical protein n=1 Tax=Nostoc sp. TaxID=1180 RepID=UPI002FF7A792